MNMLKSINHIDFFMFIKLFIKALQMHIHLGLKII